MGVMLETPSGVYKNLIVDNVAKLEDAIAHFIPEIPSNIAAPAACIVLLFALDWRMGLASLITIPLCIPIIFGMLRGYGEKMETYLRSGNEMNAALVEYVGLSSFCFIKPLLPQNRKIVEHAVRSVYQTAHTISQSHPQ